MTRPGLARAPKGAGGACRPSRRERPRGPAWVRPYQRAHRALDSAVSLIFSTIYAVAEAGRCSSRRPIRAAHRLKAAMHEMAVAAQRLAEAQRELAEANEVLGREPDQQRGDAPELMELAAARCQAVADYLPMAVDEVLFAQLEVLGGLTTGELVPEPEPPSDVRRRIPLTPRPLFVRAFLACRPARLSDRIAPALLRRRRTPRPAEVRVPRHDLQGRAPPLASTCAL
jgi:hypothetical protein